MVTVEQAPKFEVDLPEKFLPLVTERWRYKVFRGGRGGAKSWQFARAALMLSFQPSLIPGQPDLFVCAREYQSTIRDSVHRVIKSQIYAMGIEQYFDVQRDSIKNILSGMDFVFKGISRDPDGFRSLEGARYCWLEEADSISEESWEIIVPTIRRDGSEIWVSYNPHLDDDPTHARFTGPAVDPRALIVNVNWRDNPWFPEELEKERLHMMRTNPDAYDHVWEGNTVKITEATIFRNKTVISTFEPPEIVNRWYFGADFGFAVDPSVLMQSFIHENCLYIYKEAYGIKVSIKDMADLYDRLAPDSRNWPILGDSSRPETIDALSGMGFQIKAAEKWQGSVEDGIAHLKSFDWIVIHETNCPHMAQEARLYSYEVDKKTGLVLPKVKKGNDHCWDAVRYSLDGYIHRSGAMGTWYRLGMQQRGGK